MDDRDRKLLNLLQEGLPLSPRPFKVLGDQVGLTEAECIQRLERLKRKGVIRRIGGVFDSPGMGMKSTLCAMKVPEDRIDDMVQVINSFDQVTHNYLRQHEYNIWFTVTAASEDELNSVIQQIDKSTGLAVATMPVIKRYKIKAVFNVIEESPAG